MYSVEGRLALFSIGLILLAAALVAAVDAWLDSRLLAFLIGVIVSIPIGVFGARHFIRPLASTVQAVSDGIVSMKDRDFSVSIAPSSHAELRALVESYNGLGTLLRAERQGLYQRELLLDTVIQATPLSMVLTNAGDRVVYSNVAARQALYRRMEKLGLKE